MQDNDKGLKNRAPLKTDERIVMLSPALDSWKGKQYAHMPALAGEVPANNIGLAPQHEEVFDRQFHGRFSSDRTRRRVGKSESGNSKTLGP